MAIFIQENIVSKC